MGNTGTHGRFPIRDAIGKGGEYGKLRSLYHKQNPLWGWEARELALQVKHGPHKCEDCSLDSQKASQHGGDTCSLSTWEPEMGFPGKLPRQTRKNE